MDLQKIDHPCVTELIEFVNTREILVIVMEFAEGGEMERQVLLDRTMGRLSEVTAKFQFYQIAHAVAYLHSRQICHRDLKLSNILMSQPHPECVLKVSDFGISKIWTAENLLRTKIGTPLFMAPEVQNMMSGGSEYSCKADCWALGIILYQLLSGNLPHDHQGRTDGPEWSKVSNMAKDLVSQLLQVDPDTRLEAARILHHPWFISDQVTCMRSRNAMFQTEDSIKYPTNSSAASCTSKCTKLHCTNCLEMNLLNTNLESSSAPVHDCSGSCVENPDTRLCTNSSAHGKPSEKEQINNVPNTESSKESSRLSFEFSLPSPLRPLLSDEPSLPSTRSMSEKTDLSLFPSSSSHSDQSPPSSTTNNHVQITHPTSSTGQDVPSSSSNTNMVTDDQTPSTSEEASVNVRVRREASDDVEDREEASADVEDREEVSADVKVRGEVSAGDEVMGEVSADVEVRGEGSAGDEVMGEVEEENFDSIKSRLRPRKSLIDYTNKLNQSPQVAQRKVKNNLDATEDVSSPGVKRKVNEKQGKVFIITGYYDRLPILC